jgi:hypothetical protein
MAKKTGRVTARKRRPDPVTLAAALERARLKRMIQAKRDIARLANELTRTSQRARVMMIDLARRIIMAERFVVLTAEEHARLLAGAGGDEQRREEREQAPVEAMREHLGV